MRRASSTPAPSLGKNVDGGTFVHRPRAIQSLSIDLPFELRPPFYGLDAGLIPNCLKDR
jgi:hypothetical protein